MNLRRNPDGLNKLAAEYALGTLRGGARRRLEAMSREDPAIRKAIVQWQDRLSGIAELQTASQPSDRVWSRISNDLGWVKPTLQPVPSESFLQRLWHGLGFWRFSSTAMTVAAVAAIAFNVRLTEELRTVPLIHSVAVLADSNAKPAMLVTFDERTRVLTIKQVGDLPLDAQHAFELWSLPANQNPQSLGVLARDSVIHIKLPRSVKSMPALAISLEERSGSANPNGPTGPVLFSGPMVKADI